MSKKKKLTKSELCYIFESDIAMSDISADYGLTSVAQ